jgi:hypothetical protein
MPQITRRFLLQGAGYSAAGIALAEMAGGRSQVSIAKAGICQTCSGNGNCDSKVCNSNAEVGQTGVCYPNEDPCAGRSRNYFTCKGGREQCCKLTKSGATKYCKRF